MMVACPSCGESSAVQIARDAGRPWEQDRVPSGARWSASCGGCGAEWTLID